MRLSRFNIAAIILAAAALFAASFEAIGRYMARVTESWPAIDSVRAHIARLANSFSIDAPVLAYAGPDAPASLRHEAGTHRRSAARNI